MNLRSVVGKFDAEENCLYDVLNVYNLTLVLLWIQTWDQKGNSFVICHWNQRNISVLAQISHGGPFLTCSVFLWGTGNEWICRGQVTRSRRFCFTKSRVSGIWPRNSFSDAPRIKFHQVSWNSTVLPCWHSPWLQLLCYKITFNFQIILMMLLNYHIHFC